ncbi:hypothetical protein FRB99_001563 [Tulasnella sp. 403]|nr:hypothetical protein FRB99_001563 [Tulasnella sp. 403]
MPPLLPHSIQGFFFLQEVLHWSPHYSTYSPIIQSATFDKERITVSVEIPNEVHLPNPAIVYLRGTLAFSSAGDIEIKVPDKASAVVYDTALSALTKQPPNFSLIGLGKSIRFHSPKDYALDLLVQGPWDSGKTIVVRSRYNHVLMRTAQDNSLFKVEGCFAFIELRNGTIHLDAQIVLPLDNGSLFTFGSSTAFVFAPHHPIEQPTEVSQRRDHHTTAPPLRSRVGPTISSRKAGVSRLGKVSDERPHKMGLAGSQMIVKTASQIVAPASSTPKELYPDVTSLFSAPPNQSGVQSLPHPPLTLDKITHTADLNDRSHIRMNQALPIGGNPNTEISPTTFEIPPFRSPS